MYIKSLPTCAENIRTFVIKTTPDITDPAWVIVLEETTKSSRGIYSDFAVLKQLIAECEKRHKKYYKQGWLDNLKRSLWKKLKF